MHRFTMAAPAVDAGWKTSSVDSSGRTVLRRDGGKHDAQKRAAATPFLDDLKRALDTVHYQIKAERHPVLIRTDHDRNAKTR